jgi:magnesium chelatase family protein
MSGPRFCMVADIVEAKRLAGGRRICAPHHTASLHGLVGALHRRLAGEAGAYRIQPGECTLADNGVLVLDDLGEFRREAIEAIARVFHRQATRYLLAAPAGTISIEMPARFDIYATSEACPCGIPARCACTDGAKQRFTDRLRSFQSLFTEKPS